MNWRPLLRALVVISAVALGWMLRTVTVPLLAAYLMMLVWRPVHMRWARRMGRGPAALACVLLTVLLPLLLFLPTLFEVEELGGLLPTQEQTTALAGQVTAHVQELVASLPESWRASLTMTETEIQSRLARLPEMLQQIGAGLFSFLGGLFGILSALVLLPIFLYFLLQGGPWLAALRGELPPEWHARFDRVLPRIERILRTYCRSRVLVAGIKTLFYWVVLLVCGIPGAYTLALLAGVFSLLPVLGPLLAFLGLAGVAFADQGLAGLAVAGGAYLVAEIVEGYVLLPRLVGRGLGLSDFTVILAALAGGALLGMFGLLVAVPLVAVAKVLYDEFVRPVMGTAPAAGS